MSWTSFFNNAVICILLCLRTINGGYTDGTLFRENFEPDGQWKFARYNKYLRTQSYTTRGIDGHILRAKYRRTKRGTSRINRRFPLDDEVTSATLSFDVKLHSKFEFVKGGKMHGLSGGSGTTGCKSIDPDGWSVRLMWRREGVANLYIYHQDRKGTCGDSFQANFKFQRGKWYRVDLYVKMNSSPLLNDGLAELFMNGNKVVRVPSLKLSGSESVDIDTFMFSTFYGGSDSSWAPMKSTYAYYDNFAVRTGKQITGKKGSNCEIFLEGIYKSGFCCPDTCGSCGGSGCGGLPGGATNCCTGSVNESCPEKGEAPCRYD